MFIRELRPSRRYGVLTSQSQSQARWCCEMVRCDAMRSDECEIALSHPIISSSASRQASVSRPGQVPGTEVHDFCSTRPAD